MNRKSRTISAKRTVFDRFCRLAVRLGAKEARVVSTRDVFTAAWVRQKCRFGCDGYGCCLTCPPYSSSPEETRKILDGYRTAILIRCEEGPADVKEIVVQLEREVFLSGYYKAFGFGAGPCDICPDCNLERCRHPEKARPAMEAAGIDVFQTARKAGFPIEVVNSSESQPNYYGLVLVE